MQKNRTAEMLSNDEENGGRENKPKNTNPAFLIYLHFFLELILIQSLEFLFRIFQI